MGLFKRRYEKNITRDNEFLKKYAIRCNGLVIFAENNENVKKELLQLRDDFQYTVGSAEADAKGIEKKIRKDFDTLTALLKQQEWEGGEALLLIRDLRRSIVEIAALR